MTGTAEKIYSEAVFELAKEENSADKIKEELDSLSKVFTDNPELSKLLSAPTVGFEEKLDVLKKIFGGRISDTSYNLLCVTTEKGRASLIPAIAEDYRNRWYEMKNIAEVKVTTSKPLTDALRSKLKAKLEAVYKNSGADRKYRRIPYGRNRYKLRQHYAGRLGKTKLEAVQKQIKGVIA